MASGEAISGIGHGLLLVGVVVGGLFQSAPPPLETADVSVISSAEFAALTRPEATPAAATDVTAPAAPEPEAAPEPPAPEDPTQSAAAPEVEDPDPPDPQPEVPEPLAPDPEPQEDTARLLTPDVPVLETPVPAPPSDDPAPIAAPRVAPIPVPDTPSTPAIADTPAPPLAPDALSEDQAEPLEEEAAPEEATTEIVTEAETPGSGAPAVSQRPPARPSRATASDAPDPKPTPAPEESAPPNSSADSAAINDALAAALGGTSEAQPAAPLGPPLTSGERDGLRVAVQACWNTGALSTEALNVTVTVGVAMNRDGTPETNSIRLIASEGGGGIATRQAFEAARRAVIRCGTRGFGLPDEKYEQWRNIEMTFNPENMRIK